MHMCYFSVMSTSSNAAPARTVVLLRPSEKKRLQKLARDENVSASEIVRRSIHAYQSGSSNKDEQNMRGLIAEMNQALDSALASARASRKEIAENLALIKKRRESRA
jgi:Ribbon-helix-helix protein, copG family